MTKLLSKNFKPTMFDDFFDMNTSGFFNDLPMTTSLLKNENNYPPTDITSLDNNGNYYIRMSIAGFSKEDLDISIQELNNYAKTKYLIIAGEKQEDENGNKKPLLNDAEWNEHISKDNVAFMKKGIASRKFREELLIGKDDEVEHCKIDNGILLIKMHRYSQKEESNIKRIEIQ